VVCGRDRFGHHSNSRGVVCMALRGSLERMVLSVCRGLGLGYVGEQLDERYGRLLEGPARSWAPLNPDGWPFTYSAWLGTSTRSEDSGVLASERRAWPTHRRTWENSPGVAPGPADFASAVSLLTLPKHANRAGSDTAGFSPPAPDSSSLLLTPPSEPLLRGKRLRSD